MKKALLQSLRVKKPFKRSSNQSRKISYCTTSRIRRSTSKSASQQVLNTAKTTQATAEKELSVHKATLASLQAVATKSTTNYEEKVRQTATAEKAFNKQKINWQQSMS